MPGTLDYYRIHAQAYFTATVSVDLSPLHARFLATLPPGGLILDAGCGAGRDSKAFLQHGYRVHPFDACPELATLAAQHLGQPVAVRTFAHVDEVACYDGIWACASLLHLSPAEIPPALGLLWSALKPGGTLFVSFKYGAGEAEIDGRHFTYADESRLAQWLATLPPHASLDCWTTPDHRPGQPGRWLNALAAKPAQIVDRLIPGGASPFLPHLCAAIAESSEIDLAVAFIKTTGLRLLLPDLHAALAVRAARVRILTSDYLDITDPEALSLLMLLQQDGAQVRIHETKTESFHLKAYLFARFAEGNRLHGQAFIGSSNISSQALQQGLEWNYRVTYPGDHGYLEARNRFEELFRNPRAVALTDPWIQHYRQRRTPPTLPVAPGSHETEPPVQPTSLQSEALAALAQTRLAGFRRGLVVLATGLGKTWLAAFDTLQSNSRRILFVAHREEILQQAAATFLRVRPNAVIGFCQAETRHRDVDVLCASVQTLGRHTHLERFAVDHFDYIVVDEFHHAAAPTYRRLLHHFQPRFLLGLTATPHRTDQTDILSLCDDNLVFEKNLVAGVNAQLLVPFTYYGIYDEAVDYREIPWRNGQFDPEQLSNKLATLARAQHALRQWRAHAQPRTLAFCVSISHADFMAAQFQKAGLRAVAVHGRSPVSRGEALDQLRSGALSIIFSVDLFNEGVDLPEVDTVLLLRPTESKVLFLQQIGRGLRRAPGKERLIVLDFIGNHRGFFHKPQALFSIGPNYRDLARFGRDLENKRLALPHGCYVNYDLRLIEFFQSLDGDSAEKTYEALRDALGRRPTLLEFHRAGGSPIAVRHQFQSWFALVRAKQDLDLPLTAPELACLLTVETTDMTRSFKMILLEAFQELNGWQTPPPLPELAARSWDVLHRRPPLLADLSETFSDGRSPAWLAYWRRNPVNAWVGGNTRSATPLFTIKNGHLVPTVPVASPGFADLVQELIDYRLAIYEARPSRVVPITPAAPRGVPIPYFPNLKIACGHFRAGRADQEEYRHLGDGYGRLDPAKHFIARASGNSMNGGKNPIVDGDYLLFEHISPNSAGSNAGHIVALERQDASGEPEYLLRAIIKRGPNDYLLRANNPAYQDLPATEGIRPRARLRAIVPPGDLLTAPADPGEEVDSSPASPE
jgi:superfamily II DNA or RNA helicase/HKD family nuclease/SOS-response transcriptional repressor LexA